MKKRWGLLFILTFSFLLTQQQMVHAQSTSKHGLIQKMEGEVVYQKGSSFKKIPLEKSSKLSAGDVIRTGKGSSVEVLMEGTGDTLFVGGSTEIFFIHKEENLFVHVLKGNVLVSAEKRKTDNEALYIVSEKETYEVLGTLFLVSIDPVNGQQRLAVLDGIVGMRRNANSSDGSEIYPGQSINHIEGNRNPSILPVDPSEFLHQSDSSIIEAIIENYQNTRAENDKLIEGILRGGQTPPGFPNLSDEELERYRSNLESLTASLVREAIESGRVDQEKIEQLIRETNERGGPQLDLKDADKYKPELTREQIAVQERMKQLEEQRRQAEQKRQGALEEQKRQQQSLISQIEEQKKRLEERNREEQQKREEEVRKRLEEERRPAPSPPSSRPDPELEKLAVVVSVGRFRIDAEWNESDKHNSYEIYLDGNLIDTIHATSYSFTGLTPGQAYHVHIRAFDNDRAVVAEYPDTSYTTSKAEHYYEVTISLDAGYAYINIIENYNPDFLYELWLNGEKVAGIDMLHDGVFGLEIELFNEYKNIIEIFSFGDEGEELGYGLVEVEVDPEEFAQERFETLIVGPNTALFSWQSVVESREYMTLEVLNEETNELVETLIHNGLFYFIISLSPSEKYIIVEKLYGREINRYSIETMPEGSINYYEDGTISWGIPAGLDEESIHYDVYVNDKLVFGQTKDNSLTNDHLGIENYFQPWEIKVNVFSEDKMVKTYISVIKPTSFPG